MLGVLFLAGAIWWGASLVRIAGVRLSPEARTVVVPVLGLTTGSWLLYVSSRLAGELGPASALSFGLVVAAVGVLALRRPPVGGKRPARWFLGLGAVLAVALGAMNAYGVLAPTGTGLVAVEHVWADLPFHASIATSFAYGDNLPPTYPVALGVPLGYPFLVDWITGVLMVGGFGLRSAFIAVNLIVQVVFFLGVAAVTYRLSGSGRTAVVATFVLFGLGNLGWLALPADIRAAGGVGEWLRDVPWSYTGDALGDKGRDRLGTGVYLGNPTFMFLLPRRSGALGLATAMGLLLLFEELLERPRVATGLLVGALIGLLPRIHAHTAMAIVPFVLLWTVLLPLRGDRSRGWLGVWRDALPAWAAAGVVAAVLAVPEVISMAHQTDTFFAWWYGWTGEPHQAAETITGADLVPGLIGLAGTTAWFWVLNGGLLTFLVIPAFWRATPALRRWYVPFAVLFVFGNVVRTQPWEWDNSNYFVYWQVGTTILVAPLLASLLWGVPGPLISKLRGSSRRIGNAAARAAGVVCVLALTFGGMLSFAYAAQERHHLWTPQEVALAEDVRRATDPDDVVLTANAHGHPVLALSGRQAFMGFPGWFVAHGLDWMTYSRHLERMLAEGDVPLMRSAGITHVVLGPWERGYLAERGAELPEVFNEPGVFEELFAVDGWRLLELRGSSVP